MQTCFKAYKPAYKLWNTNYNVWIIEYEFSIQSDEVFLRLSYQMYKELYIRKPHVVTCNSKNTSVALLYYSCSKIYWTAWCLQVLCIVPNETPTTSRRDSSSDSPSLLGTAINSHIPLRSDEFEHKLMVSGQWPAAQEKWPHMMLEFTGTAPDCSFALLKPPPPAPKYDNCEGPSQGRHRIHLISFTVFEM